MTNRQGNQSQPDNGVLYAVIGLVALTILCIGVLIALNRDATSLIQFVMAAAIPSIPAFLAYIRSGKVQTGLDEVKEQTNGNLTRLLSINDKLHRQLTQTDKALNKERQEYPK